MHWLPERLPAAAAVRWRAVLPSDGVGGVAAAEGVVVLGCRDPADTDDLFLAFDAQTGQPLWQHSYPAEGKLDYGNSPRATPLIHEGLVYLFGAFGHLSCVDLAAGAVVWQRNLATDFGTPPLDWGLTASPLLLGERLIVQPGGLRGSIAALDPYTGETVWASGAAPPGHASPIAADLGNGPQIICYDKFSLGGWDPETGARLWSLVPPQRGDFNVPTPLWLDGRLFVTTENNGSRLYRFGTDGRLDPQPLAVNDELAPDAHSPVAAAGRIFGVSGGLVCLDLEGNLRTLWIAEDRAYREYAALMASDARLLCLTLDAQLILIDAAADKYRELGRLRLREDGAETLSHPALLGKRLYVRIGRDLLCLDLDSSAP